MGQVRTAAALAFQYAVAALAPPRCAACDAPVAVLTVFCRACASTIERAPPPAHRNDVLAALVYEGAASRAIVRMKYEDRPDLARPLGDLLWRAVEPHAARYAGSLLVPVPLHAMRLAERGYNQSALLARCVARRLGSPLGPLALVRVRDTPRQTTLSREARLTNLNDAFAVARPAAIAGRQIVLVDDVCTTGATLESAAAALRGAGAKGVTALALARVLRE